MATTGNYNFELPGATPLSKRLTDINNVKTAIGQIDTVIKNVDDAVQDLSTEVSNVSASVASSATSINQVSYSANTSLTIADKGKVIVHPSTDPAARTFTVPLGVFSPGDCIPFVNMNGAGTLTLVFGETVRLAGAGTTGNRTLTANGMCTAIKLPDNSWIISGANLS